MNLKPENKRYDDLANLYDQNKDLNMNPATENKRYDDLPICMIRTVILL